MRTIIAGSRGCTDYSELLKAIAEFPFKITTVISGTARGVDTLGEIYARGNKIPVEQYPADWSKYGKRAGYIRNEQMANVAEGALVLWDGFSPGTAHMIDICDKHNLPYYVYML